MKINDVLNCVNSVLEKEREVKGLPKMLGHFVFTLSISKQIGTIKGFVAKVDFFNMKVGAPYCVLQYTNTLPCPVDKLEETKEQMTLQALKGFFEILRFGRDKGAYENFVTGDFQGWT